MIALAQIEEPYYTPRVGPGRSPGNNQYLSRPLHQPGIRRPLYQSRKTPPRGTMFRIPTRVLTIPTTVIGPDPGKCRFSAPFDARLRGSHSPTSKNSFRRHGTLAARSNIGKIFLTGRFSAGHHNSKKRFQKDGRSGATPGGAVCRH